MKSSWKDEKETFVVRWCRGDVLLLMIQNADDRIDRIFEGGKVER